MSHSPTAALSAAGVSIWLDDLSRERITSGNLAELITTKNVVGVTTNPTIFAGALTDGKSYAAQVAELAAAGADAEQAVFEITTDDVADACDIFRGVYDATLHAHDHRRELSLHDSSEPNDSTDDYSNQ